MGRAAQVGVLGDVSAQSCELTLVRNLIAARLSARRAIVKAVAAQTNVNLRLAGKAILFTIALLFNHFALHAAILAFGRGGHMRTLARVQGTWKVPLVTAPCTLLRGARPQVEATAKRMLG